jgi:DNA-binding NarL/FixJ family response regulator
MSIRVFAADDHPVFLEGLCTVLSLRDPEIELVGSAASGDEVLAKMASIKPDVLLLDVLMPKKNGIEVTRAISRLYPEIRILMLSTYQDSHLIRDAIHAGAKGYLLKETPADQIIDAVKAVHSGNLLLSPQAFESMNVLPRTAARRQQRLSPAPGKSLLAEMTERQKEVFLLMADGHDNREIAEALSIREKTVRNYIASIYDIIGIHRRLDAVLWALENGLVDNE